VGKHLMRMADKSSVTVLYLVTVIDCRLRVFHIVVILGLWGVRKGILKFLTCRVGLNGKGNSA
jgi:hypothetical protein